MSTRKAEAGKSATWALCAACVDGQAHLGEEPEGGEGNGEANDATQTRHSQEHGVIQGRLGRKGRQLIEKVHEDEDAGQGEQVVVVDHAELVHALLVGGVLRHLYNKEGARRELAHPM